MRRNDVVMKSREDMYRFYGRVVRIVGDKALWICCGLHIHLTPVKDLEVVDYKGRIEWCPWEDGMKPYYHKTKDGWPDWERIKYKRPADRFERMPTLRKLKQMASRYHGKNVWKTPLDYKSLAE